MPYPGEHAARAKDPDLFVPDSFRRKKITDNHRAYKGGYVKNENYTNKNNIRGRANLGTVLGGGESRVYAKM